MAASRIPNPLGQGSSPWGYAKQFATIAPMVEQRTENSCVAGSSPACGTSFRIATANSKTFTVNETKRCYPVLFAPLI